MRSVCQTEACFISATSMGMYKMFGKWNKVLCCVVLVISADCETGNKWSFEMIISDQNAGRLPPGVICSVMPDPVHGGKSQKASFTNWPIILNKEQSCLGILHSLCDADPILKTVLKKSCVQNRDRMDVDAVLHITKHRGDYKTPNRQPGCALNCSRQVSYTMDYNTIRYNGL